MDLNHYRFMTVWHLKASPEEVYRVLEDIDGYPSWWPEVRSVERIDDSTVKVVVRSFLPYELSFFASESRRDMGAGVLEIVMRGDLEGFSRWTIAAEDGGTRAAFEEDVVVRKKLLRRFAGVARPFFRLNHAVMLCDGRRRVRIYLAFSIVGEAGAVFDSAA